MLTEREVFQKAFTLVSNPETWGQGTSARDVKGIGVDLLSPSAVRFCQGGALEIASYALTGDAETGDNMLPLFDVACGSEMTHWNDTHTHEEVVALWTKVGQENGWLDVGATAAEGA